MVTEKEKRIREKIKASNAFEHIEELCEIGDRFAGSKGDEEAVEYVSNKLEEFGLEVSITELPILFFERNEVSLEVFGRDEISIEANPAYFSPSTPEGGITGELVFIPSEDREKKIEEKDVQGKIVVIQEKPVGEFWLGEIGEKAAEEGAEGLVQIHTLPRPYTPSVEIGNHDVENRFADKRIPTVSISSVDGGKLLYRLGEGAEARLKVDVEEEERISYGITGILRGDGKEDEEIGLIAHRDNGISPGANDNGSGSGTMLEIARVLADEEPERSVRFISSTAEEGVTLGAYRYVQAHKDELDKMRAIFNLDMFATGGPINLVDTGYWPDFPRIEHSQDLNNLIDQIAEELGYKFGRMDAEWGVSESGRFIEEGVPGAWFWRPDDPYYHSRDDVPENIDPNSLKAVGDVTAVAVWRLANSEDLSIEQEVPKA